MIAFQLRCHVFAGQGLPENEAFFLKLTPVIVFTSLIFYNVNHLYETHRYTSWYQETLEIVLANLQSLVTFVFLLYFFAPGRFSRLTIFFYLPTTQVTMVAARLLARFFIRHSRRKDMNLRYTVLVGGLVIWRGCSQSRIERGRTSDQDTVAIGKSESSRFKNGLGKELADIQSVLKMY